jgi:uncharacterized protein (TIGR03663 family)
MTSEVAIPAQSTPVAEKWKLTKMGWAILLAATLLRIWMLDVKPPHFDEGVNGWFVDRMTRTGYYDYNPDNFHGPFHFYPLWLSQTLLGRSSWALRLPVVLAGIACVYLILRFDRYVGRAAAHVAAWFMAISPGFVFYERYAIHEVWQLMATMLMVWGMLRLLDQGDSPGLYTLGGGFMLAVLTKETWIMHAGTLLLAFPCLWLWEKRIPSSPEPSVSTRRWTWRQFWGCAGLCLFAYVFFYSGNFFDWKGLGEPLQSLMVWTHRGSNEEAHAKAWYYWLDLIRRYEWHFFAGLAGMAVCAFRGSRPVRLIAIYGFGCFLAYTIVKYKTPWCIISFLWPFTLMAGVLCTLPGLRGLGAVAAVVLSVEAVLQTSVLNFVKYADESEPYVYVQTFPEIREFTEPLIELAKEWPSAYHLHGTIILTDHYPLPWMLGDFNKIGWYKGDSRPGQYDVDFLAIQTVDREEIEERLVRSYFVVPFRVRAGQGDALAYFDVEKFAEVFPDREPDFVPVERPEVEGAAEPALPSGGEDALEESE